MNKADKEVLRKIRGYAWEIAEINIEEEARKRYAHKIIAAIDKAVDWKGLDEGQVL